MDLIDKVKAECNKHGSHCFSCVFWGKGGCRFDGCPTRWDTEAIRRVLEEESDKEEIVVPNMFDMNIFKNSSSESICLAAKQNEIILCLKQIVKGEK